MAAGGMGPSRRTGRGSRLPKWPPLGPPI